MADTLEHFVKENPWTDKEDHCPGRIANLMLRIANDGHLNIATKTWAHEVMFHYLPIKNYLNCILKLSKDWMETNKVTINFKDGISIVLLFETEVQAYKAIVHINNEIYKHTIKNRI